MNDKEIHNATLAELETALAGMGNRYELGLDWVAVYDKMDNEIKDRYKTIRECKSLTGK